MGVGRRMQKQGPPPPLDESLISRLTKRGDADIAADHVRGKKRTASGDVVSSAQGKLAAGGSSSKQGSKGKFANRAQPRPGRGRPSPKQGSRTKAPLPAESSEDDDGSMSDVEKEIGLDGGGLPDDFLESGSSVYDSEPDRSRAMFSEDEDESEAEERLTAANIEGLSRRLDVEQEEEAADAQLELEEAAIQTNIDGDRIMVLGDADEEETAKASARLAPDLQMLRTRITDTIRILDDFSSLSEAGRSRADYTAQLEKDICAYYGYSPFLASKLLALFPPREAYDFFEANERPRPVVLRTNTLKTHRRDLAQALINRGVTLEVLDGKWSKVGLQVFESQVPLGATPEYLAGHYMLQAASSFLPVMALAPQEHERILDMAAAPGGKTTYIAALMKNTGCIFANDSNKARTKGLIGNIHRLGVKNTIVCNHDARDFPRVIGGFDRVLLDAPCSGTGVIAKDASIKTNKTARDFQLLPHLQKQLLLAAIDSVDHTSKTGGYVVYSTCSVTVEENEQVVQYALRKRPNVHLVETGLALGLDAFTSYMGKQFDARMKMAKRYYPHTYNVDGFFISKLQKFGPTAGAKANGAAEAAGGSAAEVGADRAPIVDDGRGEDPFGGWDEEADALYMEQARRRALRKKGLDPKAKRAVSGKGEGV